MMFFCNTIFSTNTLYSLIYSLGLTHALQKITCMWRREEVHGNQDGSMNQHVALKWPDFLCSPKDTYIKRFYLKKSLFLIIRTTYHIDYCCRLVQYCILNKKSLPYRDAALEHYLCTTNIGDKQHNKQKKHGKYNPLLHFINYSLKKSSLLQLCSKNE